MPASRFLMAFRASHNFSKVFIAILLLLDVLFETQMLQLLQAKILILGKILCDLLRYI